MKAEEIDCAVRALGGRMAVLCSAHAAISMMVGTGLGADMCIRAFNAEGFTVRVATERDDRFKRQ